MIHESMHAGNADVDDFGYIGQPSFIELPEATKLTNAAHFEVVPRRILGLAPTFAGQTFIPAGTSVGGVTAPPLTYTEQAIRAASEELRKAWTVGLNLHSLWVRIHGQPDEWTTLDLGREYGAAPGLHWSECMPFWSKVQKMTVHEKGTIDPAGSAETAPVSMVDISLSEGMVRLLARAMDQVPQTEADADAFVRSEASLLQLVDTALGVDSYRDVLLQLTLQHRVGEITGPPERDARVVRQMASVNGSFSLYLQARGPADFAD